MGNFGGFPAGAQRFLDELALNNNKQWFEGHRREFDEFLLEPAKDFVVELGAGLQAKVSPGIHAEPKINGSIMRMNRDIRFSKEKSPYKTWFGLWFWEGEKRSMESTGLYLGLTGSEVTLGAGKHGFEPEVLDLAGPDFVIATLRLEHQRVRGVAGERELVERIDDE